MTNSTAVYWSIDGVSLQTLCQNVESLSAKYKLPTHRGEDHEVGYSHGARWRKKWMAPKTEMLGMWVTGNLPDGTPAANPELQFRSNLKALHKLMFREYGEQVNLTKRWKDPITGTVYSATALGELVSDLDPTMFGPFGAKLVAEFHLAEPIYYGPPEVFTLNPGGSLVVPVEGDLATNFISVKFNGASANPEIRNESYTPNGRLKVGGAIASSDYITVDARAMTAKRNSDSANMIAAVTRSGYPQFMLLKPGNNTLSMTATSGVGSAEVTFRPAFL